MKIAVTGANGYLGQGIVTALLDRGHEVVAATYTSDPVDARAQQILGDVFVLDDPFQTLGQPDVLLHLAWMDGFVHNSPAHFDNLPGHVRFLEKMAKSGVKLISALGTMHEIGFIEGCIREETPCMPANRYGMAKDALRRVTQLICTENNVAFQWLRGFYIVGTSEKGASIFAKIVAAEGRGEKEFPFTSGQNQYDFLDYEDFCAQVAASATQTQVNGIINICSGRPEKLKDRVERFISDNGFAIRLAYGKFPDRPYDSKAVWGDDSKIRQIMEAQNNG